MDERWKNQKNRLERGDSSVSTRHYVAAGTNLYKGKTETLRKVERAVEREGDLGGIIQGKKPHPNWKPATVQPSVLVLEFVSPAEDYGESETEIIPRNKANNYLCRNSDCRSVSPAEDYGKLDTGFILKSKVNN